MAAQVTENQVPKCTVQVNTCISAGRWCLCSLSHQFNIDTKNDGFHSRISSRLPLKTSDLKRPQETGFRPPPSLQCQVMTQ